MEPFDPTTHREPTGRELSDADAHLYKPEDRVAMVGTDYYGTVLRGTLHVGQDRPLVEWDVITPEDGERSWAKPEHLVLVGVPR